MVLIRSCSVVRFLSHCSAKRSGQISELTRQSAASLNEVSFSVANSIIFMMILIAIRMNREISLPALNRSQMVLAQTFSEIKHGRAAEAVIIRNPAKALAEYIIVLSTRRQRA